MKKIFNISIVLFVFNFLGSCKEFNHDEYFLLSKSDYSDMVYASWLGQLVGNIYGLPHENQYVDNPRPDSLMNLEYGSYHLKLMEEINGAFSDDDTDIEYMYLLQMEKFGIEPTYLELSKAWTYHIRDRVWLANRAALAAMKNGISPPLSGSKKYNPHWFQIDPQLVNEIWAVTSPGMINYACEKSKWAAKITNDDWGVEPTIHYAAMYSAAFFEKDINELIKIGLNALPKDGVFYKTIIEVQNIYNKFPNIKDWKKARLELSNKFYVNESIETKTIWNANLNGACGILALLYGKGDFLTTLDIASGLGFDADNQTATMSGLLGIINGTKGIPKRLLFPIKNSGWELPFNDYYKNISRYDLPDVKISEIIKKTILQAEKIILSKGGEIIKKEDKVFYKIKKSAEFEPNLEIAKIPYVILNKGKANSYSITSSYSNRLIKWEIDSKALPDGITFEKGVFNGIPTKSGEFSVNVKAIYKNQEKSTIFNFIVFEKNLAQEKNIIISSVYKTDKVRRDNMWITVGKNLFSDNISIINDGKIGGDRSVFYSIDNAKTPHEDYYGYKWETPVNIGNIVFTTGSMEENGGWFKNLKVEIINKKGVWEKIKTPIQILPKFDFSNNFINKAHFMSYRIQFDEVKTSGIRIIGDAGGVDHYHHGSKNVFFTSITELEIYEQL
ncbi:MAG: ADP-ribosylglycohydrolase family protein [Flavobacteriaceae bacterium]|nr:ADP-ribosylglycohydrolase family protein [Flavobacteriaceae bacterium]